MSSRIIMVEPVVNGDISVYGPQRGKSNFYDELNAAVRVLDGKCVVMADFNGHVESSTNCYVRIHGVNGWKERNQHSKRLLKFAKSLLSEMRVLRKMVKN